jgi:DNA-binding transcriptional MerR regulator
MGTGEMSRASGLSLKALRLYDANGLLVPAAVDRVTGYRSYDPDQLARARAIGLLRRLDLPLARIAELLDGPPDRLRDELLGWWSGREHALHDQRVVLDLVTEGLAAPGPVEPAGTLAPAASSRGLEPVPASAVRRVRAPARKVASLARVVEQRDLVPTFTADVLALRGHLAAQGAVFGAEYWVVYHEPVRPGVAGRIETCVPYDGAADPVGTTVLRLEPERELASVPVPSVDCRYPRIAAYYDAASGWARGHGGIVGPPREVYPVPWSDDAAEVARIAVPVGRLDPAPGADLTLGP